MLVQAIARLAFSDLRQNPMTMFAPGLVALSVSACVNIVLIFLLTAVGPQGQAWRAQRGFSLSDDLAGAAMVLACVAIPAVVVVANIGAATVSRMGRTVTTWRLAGALPGQVATVIHLQIVVTATSGALIGALASTPFLHYGVGMIVTMAGADSSQLEIAASPLAVLGSVALTASFAMVGALKPARLATSLPPAGLLHSPESVPPRPGKLRLSAGAVCLLGAVILSGQTLFSPAGSTIEDTFSSIMASAALLIISVTLADPWALSWVTNTWTRLVGSAGNSSWFLARSTILSTPKWVQSLTLSTFVATSIPGTLAALLLTFQEALRNSGSADVLNYSDTIVTLTPPILIGLVGSVSQVLLGRAQLISDYSRLRLAGATPALLYRVAVFQTLVCVASASLVAGGISFTTGILTARSLGLLIGPTSPQTGWLFIATIGLGAWATATIVTLSAAKTAISGRPQQAI